MKRAAFVLALVGSSVALAGCVGEDVSLGSVLPLGEPDGPTLQDAPDDTPTIEDATPRCPAVQPVEGSSCAGSPVGLSCNYNISGGPTVCDCTSALTWHCI